MLGEVGWRLVYLDAVRTEMIYVSSLVIEVVRQCARRRMKGSGIEGQYNICIQHSDNKTQPPPQLLPQAESPARQMYEANQLV